MRTRGDLGAFTNRHPLTGEGVEICVFRGDFASQLLNRWTSRPDR